MSIFGCESGGVGIFEGVRRGEWEVGVTVRWTVVGTGPGEGVGSETGGVSCDCGGVEGVLIGGVDVCKGGVGGTDTDIDRWEDATTPEPKGMGAGCTAPVGCLSGTVVVGTAS